MGMTLFDRIMQADNTELYEIQNALLQDLAIVYAKAWKEKHFARDDISDEVFNQVIVSKRQHLKGLLLSESMLIT